MRHGAAIMIVVLLSAIFAGGCSIGDESAVRAVVAEVVDSARRGDIDFTLERLTPDNPTRRLLEEIRGDSEESYSRAVADLGEEMSNFLDGKVLVVLGVEVDEDVAELELAFLAEGFEWKTSASARKVEGRWYLDRLPELPLR